MSKETKTLNLKIEILKVETKEVKTLVWEDWVYYEHIWKEGKFSCDCSRSIFFEEEIEDCSEGKFLVRLSDNDTKEILYGEIKGDI